MINRILIPLIGIAFVGCGTDNEVGINDNVVTDSGVADEDTLSYPVNEILEFTMEVIEQGILTEDSAKVNYLCSEFLVENEMNNALTWLKDSGKAMPKDLGKEYVNEILNSPSDIAIDDLVNGLENLPMVDRNESQNLSDDYMVSKFSFPIISNDEKTAVMIVTQQHQRKIRMWFFSFTNEQDMWSVDFIMSIHNDLTIDYNKRD